MNTMESVISLPNKYCKLFDHCNHVNGEIETNVIDWRSKFSQLWERSDRLFDLLRSSDDYYRQPISLRLPLLFYFGHLPCFAWMQFCHLDGVNGVIDAVYDKLFERGVDPAVETGIVNHAHSSRFSVNEEIERKYWLSISVPSVMEYKLKVRSIIINTLVNGRLNFNEIQTLTILNMVTEHEMMHQETLMYLFAQLPIEALKLDSMNELDLQRRVDLSLSDNKWIALPGGQTSLGKPYADEVTTFSFGWDNEFPAEPTYVTSFELQSHPVRIGDFLQFVDDGGYTTSEWWSNDVFKWITESKIRHPISWNYDNSYRVNFILQRDVPIESVLDHPVIVSQSEAKAYCRWLSKQTGSTIDLPTEVEWIYAMWDWSKCISTALVDGNCNINFRHLHTLPIEASMNNKLQWQGSAFEWTSSVFRPFIGYHGSLPSYPGYSSDFFDDRHYVLLGGSFATDSTLIRRTFRNWYQYMYRYVVATFRCVKRNGHTDHPLTSVDRESIVTMLSDPNHRSISSQYFYDAHGSTIYEQITQLDEYYLFNQELKLLQKRAKDIRTTILRHSNLQAPPLSSTVNFIELGCGDGSKIEAYLLPWINSTDNVSVVYYPVDISQHAIDALVRRLKQTMGDTVVEQYVKPICSTFEEMCTQLNPNSTAVEVVMLLGSTIGNFSSFGTNNIKYSDDSPVMKLIRSIRSKLKVGDWFLCAFDLCKDTKTMVTAYSDPKGVTAAFNYNLLLRLNRELNFNFKITNYQHYAMYNPLFRRMESWLISRKQQTVSDQHGFTMDLQAYDAIQTEVSMKYTREDIELLIHKNSFNIVECLYTDEHHLPYVLCMAQAV